ncbi:hypothetical protein Bca4012_083330 [Brassica carinata]
MIILEIEKLESEAKCLGSTDAETEAVLSELKEEIEALLENLKVSENKSQEMLLNLSTSETESKENYEKLKSWKDFKRFGKCDESISLVTFQRIRTEEETTYSKLGKETLHHDAS